MDRRVWAAARTVARTVAALLSVTVLGTSAYAWSLSREIDHGMATSDALPAADRPAAADVPDAPFTALLVGLDSRTDTAGQPLPQEILDQMHAGPDEGQLHTDTIILLHVPRGPAPRAVAISFPRDSYVDIAGASGKHKINSAYGRAYAEAERTMTGPQAPTTTPAERDRRAREAGRRALVDTLLDLTGIHVDHLAEVNLAGFIEITDAVGGVPVCLNGPVREERSGIDLPAGPQTVQGSSALAFVRQRHGLTGGDLDRIGRQQAFLSGLADAALTSGLLTDPARLARLSQAVGRYVVLDRGWSSRALMDQVRRLAAGEIRFETIPVGTSGLDTPYDGIAVQVDPDEVRGFVQQRIPVHSSDPLPAPPTPGPATTTGPGPTAGATSADSTTGPDARPADTTHTGTAPRATVTTDGVPCVD